MSELEVGATVHAPPQTVWSDWVDSGALAAWFWPPRLQASASVDVDTGMWKLRSDVADMGVTAQVRAIEPPHRLGLRWQWDGEDAATDVTVMLDAVGDATQVMVVHTGFTDLEERERHVQGWTDCLARLVERHAA